MDDNEEEEMRQFEEYEKDADWFQEEIDSLANKYEGKMLAVKNKSILTSSDNIDDLIKAIEEKGEDPSVTFVSSIPPRDIVFIL